MSSTDVGQRPVVITGAAGGIGHAVARRLLDSGLTVVAIDRDDAVLSLPNGIVGDVSDSAFVNHAIVGIAARHGAPAGLVQLAGTNVMRPLPELTDDDWALMISANLSSTFYFCRAVLPLMAEAGGGSVVNTSSLFALRAEPNDAAYSAAKAGVIGLSRALALEYAAAGISINCLAPGITLTDRVLGLGADHVDRQLSRIPMGRATTPDDLAATIAFLLTEEASLYTGQVFTANGGDWMP